MLSGGDVVERFGELSAVAGETVAVLLSRGAHFLKALVLFLYHLNNLSKL